MEVGSCGSLSLMVSRHSGVPRFATRRTHNGSRYLLGAWLLVSPELRFPLTWQDVARSGPNESTRSLLISPAFRLLMADPPTWKRRSLLISLSRVWSLRVVTAATPFSPTTRSIPGPFFSPPGLGVPFRVRVCGERSGKTSSFSLGRKVLMVCFFFVLFFLGLWVFSPFFFFGGVLGFFSNFFDH